MTEAFPDLSTPRLRLRAVTEADEPSYRALLHLPEVTRFSNIADAPDRVLEKAGFRLEGIQRQKAWFKGAFHHWRFFARLADDAL